jgi:hypothetical protein
MLIRRLATFILPVILLAQGIPRCLDAQVMEAPRQRPWGAFAFQDSVRVPLPQEEAFERFLEVDAWWDHHFSQDPAEFYIEARPGGGFYEIFDESGDGILHATVIAVSRGTLLRMRGPLGFTGYALDGVYTLSFRPAETGTWVHLDVRAAGELEEGWDRAMQSVWHHFLAERFKPYAEGTLR